MKAQILRSGLLVLALSALNANACHVQGVVSCPNGNSAAGIVLSITGVGSATTDVNGFYDLSIPDCMPPATYSICLDKKTLPAGVQLVGDNCQSFLLDYPLKFAEVDFTLDGNLCVSPPPSGPCWLTGGGTIDKTKGKPHYSYGGVINPGCSPTSADGGNWNVVDHVSGIHFQGEHIVVDDCLGLPTKSPKVPVRIIDFHGNGEVSGIAGNPTAVIPVTFVGRAVDNKDGGANNDLLWLSVTDGTTTWLQIGNSAADPAIVSTGNLQIHISSCNK